jgi:arsenate reductase
MKEVGIDISEDEPEQIKELFQEHFTCVITLSDDAKERCPVWPFTRNLYHWNLVDPAATDAPPEEQRKALRRVRDEIADNVRDFASRVVPELQMRLQGRTH